MCIGIWGRERYNYRLNLKLRGGLEKRLFCMVCIIYEREAQTMEALEKIDYREQMFLTVEELGKILRISRTMAYKYVESMECPFYREKIGTRIIIPTKTFFEWYDSLTNE